MKASGNQAGGSVLIVDDESDIVAALGEIISPMVGRVDFAATGAEALRRIESFDYDLVLTDLRMPELDGRGLYARLRSLPHGAKNTVVFMTGDALDGDLRQFIKNSGIAVLEKPFTSSEVRSLVPQALASALQGSIPAGE